MVSNSLHNNQRSSESSIDTKIEPRVSPDGPVTLQVFSPLVQGALWALGGIFLSSAYAGYKARFPSTPNDKATASASGLRGYLSRLVGPALAGIRSGPRTA